MHRDVSIENILSYNGQAKLADLEYAKKMDDSTSHETPAVGEFTITLRRLLIVSQQGTMEFMSIEVAARLSLFPPVEPEISETELDSSDDEVSLATRATTRVPFSHNHLHDLESLWWVAV